MQVAVYCRVSTDRNEQSNSFAAQQRYFTEKVRLNPEWELYGIYADEGISGTSIRGRVQFCQMMEDAAGGCFQLILTKEISRFSRNILDTVSCIRQLKRFGVGVLFLQDGIDTREADSELRLSILASIAQEESRRISERVKWGQTRQMERGVVFGHSLLGYRVQNGALFVEPEGARLVQRIYRMYGVERLGAAEIARTLQEEKVCTGTGSSYWTAHGVRKILKNEKYAGDLIQKKTYTPDYLTHEKRYNHGAEEKIVLRNHHEPIISRQLWDTVQAEMRRRSRPKNGCGSSVKHSLSGKIYCGECGASFISRPKKCSNGTKLQRWGCASAAACGRIHTDLQGTVRGCNVGRMLQEDLAARMIQTAVRAAINGETERVVRRLREILGGKDLRREKRRLKEGIERIGQRKQAVLEAFFAGDISREDMLTMCRLYEARQEQMSGHLRRLAETDESRDERIDTVCREAAALLDAREACDAVMRYTVERITVFGDGRTEIRLREVGEAFFFGEDGERIIGK